MDRSWCARLALIEVLFPRRLMNAAERLVFEGSAAPTRTSALAPLARVEGLTFLWVATRREGVPKPLRALYGAFAVPMVLLPKSFAEVLLPLGYRNAEDLSVRPWALAALRALGVLYLLVAIGFLPRNAAE